VERVSGTNFAEFVHQMIFAPAGMTGADFDRKGNAGDGMYVASVVVPRLASGYNGPPAHLQVAFPYMFASAGAGLDSVIMAAKSAHIACVAARGAEACPFKLHVSSLLTRELVLALVLVGLVALMPVGLKRWKRRRKSHGAAR